MLKAQIDSLKKELANSDAECVAAKAEVESTMNKMNFIAVDATFHAWAKLMEEYKARQHVIWDLDQEIQTWKDREAVLAGGEEEKTSDGESSPMAESPKVTEPEVGVDDKAEYTAPKDHIYLVEI